MKLSLLSHYLFAGERNRSTDHNVFVKSAPGQLYRSNDRRGALPLFDLSLIRCYPKRGKPVGLFFDLSQCARRPDHCIYIYPEQTMAHRYLNEEDGGNGGWAYDDANQSFVCPSWAPILGYSGIVASVVFASKFYSLRRILHL